MIQMKTYMMTLKRMMMMALLLMVTVSAMADEQNIWLRITGNGKAQVSLDGKALTFDKDNKATVKGAEGLKVAVSVKPDNGYTVKSVTAQLTTSADNADTRGADDASFLEVTQSGSDYIFTMPDVDYNVVINVTISKKGGESKFTPAGTDLSGTYYIRSGSSNKSPDGDYYLCPTEDWAFFYATTVVNNTDNGQPFLTTHIMDSGEEDKYKWIIEKHTIDNQDYYAFRYGIDYENGGMSYKRYMSYNRQLSGAGVDRLRLHLEKTDTPSEYELFEITPYSTYLVISPKKGDEDANNTKKYLVVNGGNTNYFEAHYDNNAGGVQKKENGPSGFVLTTGIIGTYNAIADPNAPFYLEDVITRPTIGYDASGNIIITNNATSATVYYSIGGDSDPTTSGIALSGTTETLTSFEDGTIIKAVAKVGDDKYSNVVTFTAVVHVGSSNQYLIQNLECTDFYMIPGDVSSGNTTVNTTSLFRPTMSWYFSDAGSLGGVQYYYIINGSTGDYLYFTNNNVYMKTSSVFDESDGYKFSIVQGYNAEKDPDGFHIVPKGVTDNTYCIYKGGWTGTSTIANAKADAMKGSGDARRAEQRHTRWNFVLSSTLDKTPPFTITDASTHITKFYKIASVGSSGYYIVPPTDNTNATTTNSTTDANVKRGSWYFEKAQEATDADWCTYYYIRNAETGKYLYFTKDASGENIYTSDPKACLEMSETKSGDEDPYLFTWARTAAEDVNYYIVPKKLKDVSLSKISTLQRNGNTLQSNITRDAGNYAWTFDEVALFCKNPVFGESGDNIVISCIPGSAVIRYTTNGEDPSADGVTYSVYPPTTLFSKSDQHLIKACAVVSDGATPTPNTASSDVVTFIKNPDITFTEGNEIPYAGGTAVEPTISSITITPEGGSTFTIDATEYSVAFSNNTEVGIGTAIVTISDALPENNTIISGTSHFTITPKSLGNGSTAADGITITLTKIGENTYSVTVQNGTTTLTQYDADNPSSPYDYTVSGIPDESGFVATVEAKKEGDEYIGNYTGGAIAVYVKANFPTLISDTDGGSAAAYQATRDLAAPSDLKACIVTGVDYNTGTVAVQELAYIPEGVPVLLLTEGDTPHNADFTATIYAIGEGGAADVSANKLCKSDGSVTANWGQYYIFTKGEFVLSMGDNKTIKEGKYYFENEKYVSGSSPAPTRLSFTRGATTAINGVVIQKEKDSRSSVWYTIDGQKLNQKPTRKGIYIHNGHKIIVK